MMNRVGSRLPARIRSGPISTGNQVIGTACPHYGDNIPNAGALHSMWPRPYLMYSMSGLHLRRMPSTRYTIGIVVESWLSSFLSAINYGYI